jgi:hypothetical protein
MNAVQPARRDPVPDRASAQARLAQLAEGDHAVLCVGERGDQLIDGGSRHSGRYAAVTTVTSTRAPRRKLAPRGVSSTGIRCE